MRYPPPEVIASWPAPKSVTCFVFSMILTSASYVNPQIRTGLAPVNIFLVAVSGVMVVARIYNRCFLQRIATIDDWLIILALLPAIALTVTIWFLIEVYGFDRHIYDFNPGPNNENFVTQRKMEWIAEVLYISSVSLTKLSFLYFYRRLFTLNLLERFLQWFTYFVIVQSLASFLVLFVECQPLSFYWTMMGLPPPDGFCADESTILLVSGLVGIIIDIIVLALPIPAVLQLQISWKMRFQVLIIFVAGACVVTASSIRLSTVMGMLESYDVTYDGYLVWLWTGIEVNVGIQAASVPACKALFKTWHSKRQVSEQPTDGTAVSGKSIWKTTMMSTGEQSYIKMDNVDSDSPATGSDAWSRSGAKDATTSTTAWAGHDSKDVRAIGQLPPSFPSRL